MSDRPHTQFDAVFIAQRSVLLNKLVRIVSNKAVAEELAQETYVRVRQSLDQGTEINHLQGFLFQTGRNLALDYLRQVKRQAPPKFSGDALEQDDTDPPISLEPSPEDRLSDEQRLHSLITLLETLTPRQQQVFTLNRVQGWSHARIARQLGVSESTVQKEVKRVMTYCIRQLARGEN